MKYHVIIKRKTYNTCFDKTRRMIYLYNKGSENNNSHPGSSMGSAQRFSGVTTPIFILSLVLAFVIGIIGGYFVGESRATSKISNVAITTPKDTVTPATGDKPATTAPAVDYTKYIINAEKKITIDTFYQDAETKGYAKNLIGTSMPKLTWKDAAGKAHSTDELGSSYIIEMFSLTCTYCQATIPEIDAFSKENPKIKRVSLTPDPEKAGAIDKFNVGGENAFYWGAKDTGSELLMNNMPWVPAFLFVQDGKIKLVSYGGTDAKTLKSNSDLVLTVK